MTVTVPDYPGLFVDIGDAADYLLRSHSWLTRDEDTRELRMVTVDDMTPSHRAHLLDWLRRNAWVMRSHVHRSINRSAKWGSISWADRARLLAELQAKPAEEWLEETELVRRLVQLVPRPEPLPARRRRRILGHLGGQR